LGFGEDHLSVKNLQVLALDIKENSQFGRFGQKC
jgi:hypothetical protein